jgi:hypothetical protein
MEQHHKVTVPLGHRVEVTEAIHYLLHRLDCDSWYVACQRQHLYVLHLMKGNLKRYAVCFECTSPVEKGIYHGSHASSISLQPLGAEHDLAEGTIKEIKAGLLELAKAAHA